jgi:hypothetical protein
MNDFPFVINTNEIITEIRNAIINNLGHLWMHSSNSIDQYLRTQQNFISQVLNERIEGIISQEVFNQKLLEIKIALSDFLNQIEILSHRIIINTSNQVIDVLKQKVESHLIALLMPFTYIDSATV